MQQYKKSGIDLLFELISLIGLILSIALEIYYIVESETSVFLTGITILIMIACYFLMTWMQHYPSVWNLVIPVTEQNKLCAVHLAQSVKVVLMCTFFYTAICDAWNIYSKSVVFWIVLIALIMIIVYEKLKMWQINKQEKKNNK